MEAIQGTIDRPTVETTQEDRPTAEETKKVKDEKRMMKKANKL